MIEKVKIYNKEGKLTYLRVSRYNPKTKERTILEEARHGIIRLINTEARRQGLIETSESSTQPPETPSRGSSLGSRSKKAVPARRRLPAGSIHGGEVIDVPPGSVEILNERALRRIDLRYVVFDWDDTINPLMPVASGGIDAGKVDALVEIYGKDVVIQAGGGIHGHPDGTVAGARSIRCAVDGVMEQKSSPEKAEECPELKAALDKWGYSKPEEIRRIMDMVEDNKDVLVKLLFNMGYEAFETLEKLGK